MAITKRDLQAEVDRLNEKYCGKTGNELRIQGAYGGYQVQLMGKRRKDGKGYRGMGSGVRKLPVAISLRAIRLLTYGRTKRAAMFERQFGHMSRSESAGTAKVPNFKR